MTFLRLACFSLDLNLAFMAFILASAALCSLLPFLYLPIFALSLAMAASSFESFFFSFLVFFLALCSFSLAFLPPFLTIFFLITFLTIFFLMTFLRLACFSLDLNLAFMAFILASA